METPSGFLMRNSVGAHRRASFFIPVLIINMPSGAQIMPLMMAFVRDNLLETSEN